MGLPLVHLCLYRAGELTEQHKRVLLSAQLRQAPALPHGQCGIWRIVARPAGQAAAQSRADLRICSCELLLCAAGAWLQPFRLYKLVACILWAR
jgi:hypothetical protein